MLWNPAPFLWKASANSQTALVIFPMGTQLGSLNWSHFMSQTTGIYASVSVRSRKSLSLSLSLSLCLPLSCLQFHCSREQVYRKTFWWPVVWSNSEVRLTLSLMLYYKFHVLILPFHLCPPSTYSSSFSSSSSYSSLCQFCESISQLYFSVYSQFENNMSAKARRRVPIARYSNAEKESCILN